MVHQGVRIEEYGRGGNLQNQKKDSKSFFLVGTGHSDAILICAGLTATPFLSTIRPKNSIDFLNKWHFLGFNFKLWSAKRPRTSRKFSKAFSKFLPNVVTSSR